MTTNILRFALLLILSLIVGTMFGIWIGYDPASLSATAYVEQQQNAIRALNTLLPVLGALCILLTAVLAFLSKGDTRSRSLLVAAAICLIGVAFVTRFENQPINAVVMTWSPQAPPANWMQLRDAWWHWHIVRSVTGIAGLSLVLLSVLGSRR